MNSAFDIAYSRTALAEGGFTADPNDRGNWTTGVIGKGKLNGTKYGISAMSFPNEDIRNLTPARAKELAKEQFWDRAHCDEFRFAFSIQFFDAAYNHGPGNAVRFAQRAAGAVDDGVFGPNTLAACKKMDERVLIMGFLAERLKFMTNISTWSRYGKGWARRVADNLEFATKDVRL